MYYSHGCHSKLMTTSLNVICPKIFFKSLIFFKTQPQTHNVSTCLLPTSAFYKASKLLFSIHTVLFNNITFSSCELSSPTSHTFESLDHCSQTSHLSSTKTKQKQNKQTKTATFWYRDFGNYRSANVLILWLRFIARIFRAIYVTFWSLWFDSQHVLTTWFRNPYI